MSRRAFLAAPFIPSLFCSASLLFFVSLSPFSRASPYSFARLSACVFCTRVCGWGVRGCLDVGSGPQLCFVLSGGGPSCSSVFTLVSSKPPGTRVQRLPIEPISSGTRGRGSWGGHCFVLRVRRCRDGAVHMPLFPYLLLELIGSLSSPVLVLCRTRGGGAA